ncbi:S1C family serine protease [Aquibacillus kalidii]|uniref:S1C family serine protease n=1 Tax=Aquibacillus kalidii TaxID=2762597 RepID=UPI0016464969|nr:S1C family serine protease [Aquibacillus kalidii]
MTFRDDRNNNKEFHQKDRQQEESQHNFEQEEELHQQEEYADFEELSQSNESAQQEYNENSYEETLQTNQDHYSQSGSSNYSEESDLLPNAFTETPTKRVTDEVKKPKGILSMFLSGIAGGLVVAVTGATLIGTGVLDIPSENVNSPNATETASSLTESSSSNNVITTIASEDNSSLSAAITNVSDAVVGVSNIQQVNLWEESEASGTGSGVIYKKEDGSAYVVTNNHVVEGAKEVEVILTNGEHVQAEVLGTDELTDLAVLKIDASQVTQVAPLGTSKNLSVGETAIAIGNPLGTEFAGSVTKGIISGLERSVEMDLNSDGQADWTTEVIQTDAAINPGNSGGALINSSGQVIGINSMKIAQEAVEGIGFAIPIDDAKPIIEQLENGGSVERPFIGISAISLSNVPDVHKQRTLNLDDSVTDGVVIADTQPGSPADQAGLQQYDVITKLNDKDITTMLDLKQYLYSETGIGDKITVTYYRDGEEKTTSLTLSTQNAETSDQN